MPSSDLTPINYHCREQDILVWLLERDRIAENIILSKTGGVTPPASLILPLLSTSSDVSADHLISELDMLFTHLWQGRPVDGLITPSRFCPSISSNLTVTQDFLGVSVPPYEFKVTRSVTIPDTEIKTVHSAMKFTEVGQIANVTYIPSFSEGKLRAGTYCVTLVARVPARYGNDFSRAGWAHLCSEIAYPIGYCKFAARRRDVIGPHIFIYLTSIVGKLLTYSSHDDILVRGPS